MTQLHHVERQIQACENSLREEKDKRRKYHVSILSFQITIFWYFNLKSVISSYLNCNDYMYKLLRPNDWNILLPSNVVVDNRFPYKNCNYGGFAHPSKWRRGLFSLPCLVPNLFSELTLSSLKFVRYFQILQAIIIGHFWVTFCQNESSLQSHSYKNVFRIQVNFHTN